MTIRICLPGAIAWAGSVLARAQVITIEILHVSVIPCTYAPYYVDYGLDEALFNSPIYASAKKCLAQSWVRFLNFAKPKVATASVMVTAPATTSAVASHSALIVPGWQSERLFLHRPA